MTSNLDRSLDEILSTRPRGGRGRRGVANAVGGVRKRPQRAAAAKASAAVTQQSTRAPAKAVPTGPSGNGDHSKIIVSNLPLDVTEKMIKEYFSKVVGPVRSCALSYGPNGQSRGIATIAFNKAGDADRAAASYNGVLVDKRPMKVELVVEPKPITLADRVGPPNKAAVQSKPTKGPKPATTTTTNNNAPRGKVARGRAGRGRGGRLGGRKPKTAEELDAEMADYWVPGNPGTAGATADAPAYTAPAGDAMMDDQVL